MCIAYMACTRQQDVISKKTNYKLAKGLNLNQLVKHFLYNRKNIVSGVDLTDQSFSTEVDGQEGSVHSKWLAQGNYISKKTNYKKKVTSPVFLYNRYMSLTDQFLQYYSFLHKSVKWSKKFFVHCLNMVILNAHILHKKYSDSKIMHWQFRIQLVKHMLSNA